MKSMESKKSKKSKKSKTVRAAGILTTGAVAVAVMSGCNVGPEIKEIPVKLQDGRYASCIVTTGGQEDVIEEITCDWPEDYTHPGK